MKIVYILHELIDKYSGSITLGVYSDRDKLDAAKDKYIAGICERHPDDKKLPHWEKEKFRALTRKKLWHEKIRLDVAADRSRKNDG